MKPKMTAQELQDFLDTQFVQVADIFRVLDLAPNRISVAMAVGEKDLRPGGTLSGPTMFALADVSVYLAILAMIGPKALAVTTSCSMDFMRKPAAGVDLLARARLLKLGRVLAVGDVLIYSQGQDAPVARASMTYSIPPTPG
jgi:uncharacterized protein (TIGR00369 family)